jgi:class 3 adenylate cyclase
MKTEALPPVDYGIGIHVGMVREFDYQPVYQPGNKTIGIGLLGHAINLAHRVEETTKDHTHQIICTKRVYDEAIAAVATQDRKKVEKWFTMLGRHKLRGMRSPVTLYGIDGSLVARDKGSAFPGRTKTGS